MRDESTGSTPSMKATRASRYLRLSMGLLFGGISVVYLMYGLLTTGPTAMATSAHLLLKSALLPFVLSLGIGVLVGDGMQRHRG